MYDDFKLKKKPLVSIFYTKIFQRCNGYNAGHFPPMEIILI